MKLVNIQEAKYHGAGLSQREREDIVHEISNNIKISNTHVDDWRISLSTEENYMDVKAKLKQLYGEYGNIDGYSSGHFKENVHPRWKIKDHQIVLMFGFGEVEIEISKL